MSDLVSTKDIWPRIASVFGLDAFGKHITRFELVIAQPFPVVRIEMFVSAGQALDLQSVLAEYELRRKSQSRRHGATGKGGRLNLLRPGRPARSPP